MTSRNDSQWLSKRDVSRRAVLRAGLLGAAIPGLLYVAKSAASADAAGGDVYIPGAPNFLELGYGWPGKEANAGKISYRRWSDALDIVGAGTAAGYRKVKIWDDLYVQGLVNLRAYVVDPEVPPTWTAFLYARSINGQTKPFWKDTTGTAQPLVARSATLIVAASNASPRSKLGADYVCDGVADEVEINAAIAALPSGGGKVVLTEGRFTLSNPISLNKCVEFCGAGQATSILLVQGYTPESSAAGVIKVLADSCYVHDFSYDGNNDMTLGVSYGIRVDGADYVRVERVMVQNTRGVGIRVSSCNRVTISDCVAVNCNSQDPWGSIGAYQADECQIARCKSVDSPGFGIRLVNSRNSSIESCLCENATGFGIDATTDDAAYGSGIIIANNRITQCGNIALNCSAVQATIIGNYLFDCWKGMDVSNQGTILGRYIVIANEVHKTRDSNICIDLCGAPNSTIAGNIVSEAQASGIAVYESDSVVVSGNIAFNCGQDATLDAALRAGIRLWGTARRFAENCIVSNNVAFDDQATATQLYGIMIAGDEMNQTQNNIVTSNVVFGNKIAQIYNWFGEKTAIDHNQGYTTENSGKSIQSGNGSTKAFKIAHGCDATPTSVYVTPGHPDCGSAHYVSAIDGADITVTFGSAPPPGTNNVVLYWRAQV